MATPHQHRQVYFLQDNSVSKRYSIYMSDLFQIGCAFERQHQRRGNVSDLRIAENKIIATAIHPLIEYMCAVFWNGYKKTASK